MIKQVLFDMDGTLLDTEKIYHVVEMEAASELGFDFFTHQDALDMRSLYHNASAALMYERYGDKMDYEAYYHLARQKFLDAIAKDGIPLKSGVFEIIEYLKKKGVPASVVTATRLENAKRYLSETGLAEHFTSLVSAHEVKLGKPNPDPYLYACEKLGISPEEAVCIEDSPNGVKSGSAAGCITIMIPDLTEPEEELLPLIHEVVPSLKELPKALDKLLDK